MGRISSTIAGIELRLLNRFRESNATAALASLRLASQRRILSPADDPTAFTSLVELQAEMAGVRSTLSNVTAASSMVSGAQLALDQIRTQLEIIRDKATEDQGQVLDSTERAANQASIDEAIAEIEHIVGTTVGGRRVLDGSADFTLSGINNAQISSVSVISLANPNGQTIAGTVSSAGTRASLTHTEVTGLISANATLVIAGDLGQAEVTLANGNTLAAAAQKINDQSNLTGVTAAVSGNDLVLSSVAFGSDADIAITVSSGTFVTTGGNGNGTANGTHGAATINGKSVTGRGNTFTVDNNGFRFSVTFAAGFSGAFSTVTAAGRALQFALSTDLNRPATLAIPGLQPARLGGLSGRLSDLLSGGSLAGLGTKAATAARVANEALAQLTIIEARVDGFANATIDSSSALLQGLEVNLQSAIDSIDEVDPLEEARIIDENQLLAANALAGLSILHQQRQSVMELILQIANLSGSARL